MKIQVHVPTSQELETRGVSSWPIWTKEVSQFPWSYDSKEECYLLEGRVTVTDNAGNRVTFGRGDFVTFEAGLICTWEIHEPVRKHYRFC